MRTRRVFSEADVERIVEDVLITHAGRRGVSRMAQQVVRDARSELTERVIARSQAQRLVAVALTWAGVSDGAAVDAIPDEVWRDLHERQYVQTVRDGSGEGVTRVTSVGRLALLAELAS